MNVIICGKRERVRTSNGRGKAKVTNGQDDREAREKVDESKKWEEEELVTEGKEISER